MCVAAWPNVFQYLYKYKKKLTMDGAGGGWRGVRRRALLVFYGGGTSRWKRGVVHIQVGGGVCFVLAHGVEITTMLVFL